jgi:hypothetical protein
MTAIDYSKLFDVATVTGEDDEETRELQALYRTAQSFIGSFHWHGEIKRALFGLGVADIVGVFLVELAPVSADIDSMWWVVVGDVPPAYLPADRASEPDLALEIYIHEMRRWVEAVREGGDLADMIPVNAPPTIENAADLEKRLNFLETEIIAWYRQDREDGA